MLRDRVIGTGKKIEAEAAMLSKKESKLCKVERVQEQNIVKVDEELVMEVTDNLLEMRFDMHKKYCFADKEKGWFSYNFC